ncbi:uncharacterized protein LOC114541705 [Dendronephthya gigantea]|uniref:uncharacterized protein LOC114541705 n=1 Tax=Dendronephthya gigantea TaxID=151771 RepID=UPI001068DF28|nr:uncharacterized protein LOC114541705 [Dendronephthya gigantea]
MTTRSNTAFTNDQMKDALRLAKGLFESKVLVKRPPTTAQRATYNTSRPQSVPKSSSHRTKKLKPNKSENQLVNPVWRPFSQDKSLSQARKEIIYGKRPLIRNVDKEDHGINDTKPRLPRGIDSMEPWMTDENLESWTGIPANENCFVMLPSGFAADVNCLPPPQSPTDTLLERSVQEIKAYVPPKILHNYNYLENEDQSFQCQHGQKQQGKLESRENMKRLETSEIIMQEIEELEQLLQGYGNPNSSSIVNLYQHEITTLKEMVVTTLRDYTLYVILSSYTVPFFNIP